MFLWTSQIARNPRSDKNIFKVLEEEQETAKLNEIDILHCVQLCRLTYYKSKLFSVLPAEIDRDTKSLADVDFLSITFHWTLVYQNYSHCTAILSVTNWICSQCSIKLILYINAFFAHKRLNAPCARSTRPGEKLTRNKFTDITPWYM